MSRTNQTAFDSQTTVNATLSIPVVNLASNYGKDQSKESDRSIYSNSMTGVDRTLEDYFELRSRKKSAGKFDLNTLYPSTTNKNVELGILERFIIRTTEADGTIHEDPTKIWLNVETNYGANIVTGEALFGMILRMIGGLVDITVTEGVTTVDYSRLDQLLRGDTIK